MPTPIRTAQSTVTALTDAYGSTAWVLPRWGRRLDSVDLHLTAIAGATTITWFLAEDAAGEKTLTPATTSTIGDHDSDGTGSVSAVIGRYIVSANNMVTTIYLFAKTNAGTANLAITSGVVVCA